MKFWILLFVALVVAPQSSRWLFVGDSLTLARPGYVDLVSEDAARVVCYHLADCILDWPSGRYDVVVIELGVHAVDGCDHLPGHDLEVFKARYARILELAGQSGGRVIALGVPWLGGWGTASGRAESYNTAIEKMSQATGAVYVDAWGPMVECGAACIGEDGFHPSAAGYERIAQAIQEVR